MNVGAPSNACQVKDRTKLSPGQDLCPILEQQQEDGVRYATGMRQMPAITWHDGALYVVMNSRDQLDVL